MSLVLSATRRESCGLVASGLPAACVNPGGWIAPSGLVKASETYAPRARLLIKAPLVANPRPNNAACAAVMGPPADGGLVFWRNASAVGSGGYVPGAHG